MQLADMQRLTSTMLVVAVVVSGVKMVEQEITPAGMVVMVDKVAVEVVVPLIQMVHLPVLMVAVVKAALVDCMMVEMVVVDI